jgi:2-oxoglutarate dehydrogenase E1 component
MDPNMNPAPRAIPPAVNGWQAEYLDAQYQQFRQDPASVPPDLRSMFQGFDLALSGQGPAASGSTSGASAGVEALVRAYRESGHLAAKTDPFGRPPSRPASLSPSAHGITEQDLSSPASGIIPGAGTVREVIDRLESTYCGPIGVEFMHIPDQREREWFLSRIERGEGYAPLTTPQKIELLAEMTAAEGFDRFLGKRYQSKKRFSLEGGESLIPALKSLARRTCELGAREMILGMAHRGRLSVLRNVLGKDLQKLFTEFEDSWTEGGDQGGGDVKYHRGYSHDMALADGKKIHLSMLNNPSHLESVGPVVVGRCRARQDYYNDVDRRGIVPLLVHGDAALAGQGVVSECLAMSGLEGYTVGGTLHVVINNLVGFTTDPADSRSTGYCTDIAKFINAPIFHVCGDDPEAVVRACVLAAEYRAEFHKDVFVDIVCFRRHGHNEQDEPTYTQPQLYAMVREHPGPAEKYRRSLIQSGVISEGAAQAMIDALNAELDAGQAAAQKTPVNPVPPPGGGSWQGIVGKYSFDQPATAVSKETIAQVCDAMGRVPDGFTPNAKLKGLIQSRGALVSHGKITHAEGEQLAIGTLLLDGVPVRLSGQDCRRGTFTQRHAVVRDEVSGKMYTFLDNIRPDQSAKFGVWDSPLSEFAVMGFDYGYSRAAPKALVMWEGQFGDFANGAQVMIDQFLSSSESKWSRWAGLVLLLPHGYEGQGPEHSSARLERFLLLCAEENMEVVYPTTGAQVFHMLRRQVMRNFRKPLVVMTPKKYLRFEASTIDELSTGQFQHLINDPARPDPKSVKRVIYCTGKVYHELNDRRVATGRSDVALVRIEQLYPFHEKLAKEIDGAYPASAERVWVQEEPRNQGAYLYIADVFRTKLGRELTYIGRVAAASPSTGSEKVHHREQDAILTAAIGPAPAKDGGKDPKSGAAVNGTHEPAAAVKGTKAAAKA